MQKFTNIYSEWVAAMNGTWFTTRSPFPDVPCYISPVKLLTCRNSSWYLPSNAPVSVVKDYLEQQVLILKYNNPEHTPLMVKSAIVSRLAHWMGNAILKKDAYYLGELLDSIINVCFEEECSLHLIYFEKTKYWYSDEIIKMSGVGGSHTSDRFKAKQTARNLVISEGYRDDLRFSSLEYKDCNFNVLPTIKILIDATKYSRNTVVKHGDDFYILRVENIGQRVQKAREVYPKFNQQEIASLIGESKRTVREYWKIKTRDSG